MTRRPTTRAAAEAKPAPKTAKKTKAQAAPKRGTKAASETPVEDGKAKRASPSKSAKASAARKPATEAAPAKAFASKAPAKKAAKTAAGKRPATSGASAKATAARAARGTPKPARPGTGSSAKTAAKTATKAPATPARAAAKTNRAGKPARPATRPKTAPRRKVPREPAYLAAELGQPVDREGEPIGAGSAMLNSDSALQDYSLRLWRQMQSGGVVNRYMRAIERAGLTVDEVWTAGVIETRSTSSTADEMRRYKQKLLFRANLLEAILSETVADLHRLDGIEPADAPSPPQDAAAGST